MVYLNMFWLVNYGLRNKSLLMRIMPSLRPITLYCALKKESHCQLRLIISFQNGIPLSFCHLSVALSFWTFLCFRNCCIFTRVSSYGSNLLDKTLDVFRWCQIGTFWCRVITISYCTRKCSAIIIWYWTEQAITCSMFCTSKLWS